jgi:hypothetical protein
MYYNQQIVYFSINFTFKMCAVVFHKLITMYEVVKMTEGKHLETKFSRPSKHKMRTHFTMIAMISAVRTGLEAIPKHCRERRKDFSS